MTFSYTDIAKMIDHSLLAPSLTPLELEAGCRAAAAYGVASVCIVPYFVGRCAELLRGSGVVTGTTIGFPHGGHTTAIKAAEARRAVADGARELDMVVNISQVIGGDWAYVRQDIRAVLNEARNGAGRLKVIFENCYLNESQKIRLCEVCTELGVDWVKTSTGFGTGGATPQDLRLMLDHVGTGVQVKAAGGVRDLDTLLRYREMGVTRIGTSKTAELLNDCRKRLGLPAFS